MANCIICAEFDNCPWRAEPNAMCSRYRQRKMTNADRIHAMTIEELTERLHLFVCVHLFDSKVKCEDSGCGDCWRKWLNEEATDEH